jgi:ketosteroid isomerase-like protein
MHATDTPDTDLAVLRELNRNYVRAVQESDIAWFERNLADDFLNSNPDCSLVDRAGFLMQIARPPGVTCLQEDNVNIRLLGDFALIHAKTSYVKDDGRPGIGRYTDVWTRRQDRWLCIAAHVNRG